MNVSPPNIIYSVFKREKWSLFEGPFYPLFIDLPLICVRNIFYFYFFRKPYSLAIMRTQEKQESGHCGI